jgi:hypothetical protein
MEAAALEPEPFDVPIHLGPGMPPNANWLRAAGPDDSASTGPATNGPATTGPAESEATGSVSA